jgi:hypothetical protein
MAGVRLLIVGSWTRVVITASLLLAFWLVIAWLAATGRLADLRYVNVPLVHLYPPAGYVQNPFNPSNRGDLINVSEAARVKADLLRDGQVELQALEAGDPALLGGADTGRAREKLAALIAKNNASGLIERQQMKLDAIVVGRLPDPNDPSIVWAVEERGIGTISRYSKSGGSPVSQQTIRFTAKFWLLKLGERYLIADVLITSEPASAASR